MNNFIIRRLKFTALNQTILPNKKQKKNDVRNNKFNVSNRTVNP